MYELNGTVKRIGETMVFANNFTKRELVITEAADRGWSNVIAFAFKRDNCGLLDAVSAGDEVKVGFVVDGREWTDPKTGHVRCFVDLTAVKLEVVRRSAAGTGIDDAGYPF